MADDEPRGISNPERLEDDQPAPLEPGLPPEVASPLAPFKGARPASPAWFDAALARAPERTLVPVEGANIELLTWGKRGKPGLIFVHGNSAHADWWSFIAPFFADAWRVAAVSLSGMGASDWRERYSFETYAEEIHQCGLAAGLYEAPDKPVYVGHSFGGAQVFHSAVRYPERMSACVLVDTGFGGPPSAEEMERWEKEEAAAGQAPGRWRGLSQRTRPNRVYPTLEEALARFRFMPPQVPGNLYIADFIARRSLKAAPMADGSGQGWTWRFDPGLWTKLDRSGMIPSVARDAAPLVHIYGDRSAIVRRHRAMGRDLIPADTPRIVIPDCEHHIMVDQPLALVAALRALLAVWPAQGRRLEARAGVV
ncbi:MAG: alpha/beta hydrolase [Pseudomonadota bacterium]